MIEFQGWKCYTPVFDSKKICSRPLIPEKRGLRANLFKLNFAYILLVGRFENSLHLLYGEDFKVCSKAHGFVQGICKVGPGVIRDKGSCFQRMEVHLLQGVEQVSVSNLSSWQALFYLYF